MAARLHVTVVSWFLDALAVRERRETHDGRFPNKAAGTSETASCHSSRTDGILSHPVISCLEVTVAAETGVHNVEVISGVTSCRCLYKAGCVTQVEESRLAIRHHQLRHSNPHSHQHTQKTLLPSINLHSHRQHAVQGHPPRPLRHRRRGPGPQRTADLRCMTRPVPVPTPSRSHSAVCSNSHGRGSKQTKTVVLPTVADDVLCSNLASSTPSSTRAALTRPTTPACARRPSTSTKFSPASWVLAALMTSM
jgi:hypothetical protein